MCHVISVDMAIQIVDRCGGDKLESGLKEGNWCLADNRVSCSLYGLGFFWRFKISVQK